MTKRKKSARLKTSKALKKIPNDQAPKKAAHAGKVKKSPRSVMMGLVTLREAASLSQQEVANELAKIGGGRFKCGTAKSVVNRLENGGTSPGYDHMHAYAKVFGIPVGAFFVSTHLVYRLREGDHDGLIQYIEGLEQLISIARQLGKNGPIPDELDQKHAFESLFDGWLEKGVDERQSEERSTPGE